MHVRLTVLAALTAVVLTPGVQANEKPSDAYVKAMKDIGKANTELRTDIIAIGEIGSGTPDFGIIGEHAAALRAAFKTALDFWTAKKADDAIQLVQTALKAADELDRGAKERDYDTIATAHKTLGSTCGPCHTAHRQRLEDGSFEIK